MHNLAPRLGQYLVMKNPDIACQTVVARIYVTVTLCCASLSALAGQANATTTVYPTGTHPTDVQNVQAAIDAGGSVLLKATDSAGSPASFNFGTATDTPNCVFLTNDVSIRGETVAGNQTTISGGLRPISSGSVSVTASIEGLKFDKPNLAAFLILQSNGISILNNQIIDPVAFLNGVGFTESSGIYLFGDTGAGITGQVIVSGNRISGLKGEFEFGLQADGVAATMNISNNTLNLADVVGGNYGDVDSEGIAIVGSSGAATISRNKIFVGAGVCYDPIVIFGAQSGTALIEANQISIAPGNCYDAIGVFGITGQVEISRNSINSASAIADGIELVGGSLYGGDLTNALVHGNSIIMQNSSYGGISLYGAVSQCTIASNQVSGSAAYALDGSKVNDPSDICQQNAFLHNDTTQLTASVATIFLDTNTVGNIVKGPFETVIDYGTGNRIRH